MGTQLQGGQGSLSKKRRFEQSCEGSEGLAVVATSRKSTPGGWNSRYRGPEVGMPGMPVCPEWSK